MLNKIQYYISKALKYIQIPSIKESIIHPKAYIGPQSNIINSTIGRYSYCGLNCTIVNAEIGQFTSISDNVTIGGGNHPLDNVSTSPAFYINNDYIPKIANVPIKIQNEKILIASDVWIGTNVIILAGCTLGTGCVIGAGAVITRDVPPYAICVGNPGIVKKYRFDLETRNRLLRTNWWDLSEKALSDYVDLFDNVTEFLKRYENQSK